MKITNKKRPGNPGKRQNQFSIRYSNRRRRPNPYQPFERHRTRLLRYLWIKCKRAISANDSGWAEPVTPIKYLVSLASAAASGTKELEAVLGVNNAVLEEVFQAIAAGKRIIVQQKAVV
jgi:hypothetical protein